MRSHISNFNASYVNTTSTSPQAPPRRRAQSVGTPAAHPPLSVPRRSLHSSNSVSLSIQVFQFENVK